MVVSSFSSFKGGSGKTIGFTLALTTQMTSNDRPAKPMDAYKEGKPIHHAIL